MQRSSQIVRRSHRSVVRAVCPMTHNVSGSDKIKRHPSMACVPVLSKPACCLARWWTVVGSPIAPAATSLRVSMFAGAYLPWWPIMSLTLFSSQAEIMASACPSEAAIGFSPMIPFTPAFAAATVASARGPCHVVMLTMSKSSFESISSTSV